MNITVNHINKNLKGRKILEDVCLEMQSGTVYGFVGKNGSGKTMLFRAISGLMPIDSGTVICNGKQLHKEMKILPNLGIQIENAGLYPELTGFRNLQLLAKLNNKIDDEQIRDTIRKVGLDSFDKRPFHKYSLGMKQRIVLAQALMEKPDILMLDEPTNTLDEDGINDIRNLILEEKRRGALIMIASHNKEDIHLLADIVYQIKEGCVLRGRSEDEN